MATGHVEELPQADLKELESGVRTLLGPGSRKSREKAHGQYEKRVGLHGRRCCEGIGVAGQAASDGKAAACAAGR